jgi:hypothetical protein
VDAQGEQGGLLQNSVSCVYPKVAGFRLSAVSVF